MADGCFSQRFLDLKGWAAKAHHFLANAFLNDLVESDEGAATDEKNLFCVHLDVLLMRMFAPPLWRNIASAAFQDFQKRLLNAFAGNVPGNAYVVRFPTDLVDLVNVNNANLRSFHIVIGVLQKTQNDVLDILPDIAGFS